MSTLAKTAKAAVEPVRQRTQYSCMAASMTMCLKALGYDSLDEDQVNRVMGAQPMKGAAWEQALACAQHYGCRATLTMPATVEQLKAWTDAGIPIMIAWNPEGRPWSHASVVFDVDADLNVYVADPNIPNPKETVRVVPEAEFYGKWYEKFPDYLVRRPAMALEREITLDGKQVAPRTASASRKVAEAHDCAQDYKAGGLTWEEYQDCLRRSQSVSNDWAPRQRAAPPREAPLRHPTPSHQGDPAKLRVLDTLLAQHPSSFVQSIREQVARGKTLSEAQLKAVRQVLYKSRMKPDADLFRAASVERQPGSKTARPQETTKTEEERRQDKSRITIPPSTPRNDVARALRERGGLGQGSHKNKQDYDRGRARQPKHRNQDREASGPVTWERLQKGAWSHHDKALGVYALIVPTNRTETVQDPDIPSLDEFADPELLADGIPELEKIYSHAARNWDQWQRQGWWPKPVKVPGLQLVVFYEPTKHAFEAWFKPNEMAKAQAWGAIAIEKIGNRKYPRWLTPLVSNPNWVRKLGAALPDVSSGWARAAKHLLETNKDLTQNALHYRAYLRAVIRGSSDQMTHLNKMYPGAHQAQVDLIDLFGTGKFASIPVSGVGMQVLNSIQRKGGSCAMPHLGLRIMRSQLMPVLAELEQAGHLRRAEETLTLTPQGDKVVDAHWAAYSGNPDGKPIYPVEVDHGESEALSGGHDVMKRLQDQYRIEQGGVARENQETRLARLTAYTTPTETERTERLARRFLATTNGGLR